MFSFPSFETVSQHWALAEHCPTSLSSIPVHVYYLPRGQHNSHAVRDMCCVHHVHHLPRSCHFPLSCLFIQLLQSLSQLADIQALHYPLPIRMSQTGEGRLVYFLYHQWVKQWNQLQEILKHLYVHLQLAFWLKWRAGKHPFHRWMRWSHRRALHLFSSSPNECRVGLCGGEAFPPCMPCSLVSRVVSQ